MTRARSLPVLSLLGCSLLLVVAAASQPQQAVRRTPRQEAGQPSKAPTGQRAGGDTCEAATVITALPFTDTGNTCSASQDYSSDRCSGDGGPDVVYTFTPASSVAVSISLCGSSYATLLSLYADACLSEGEIVCNTAGCGSQSWLSAYLAAGRTYYIVVSGHWSDCGAYTLSVSALQSGPGETCQGATLISALPFMASGDTCQHQVDHACGGTGLDTSSSLLHSAI